jgi:uncharacterized protein with GYD domain
LIFISLGRFKKKPTYEMSAQATKMLDDMKMNGIDLLGFYWTLGRYDTVLIFDAPSEKDAMKIAINVAELVATETMVAFPREEATKLL